MTYHHTKTRMMINILTHNASSHIYVIGIKKKKLVPDKRIKILFQKRTSIKKIQFPATDTK